VVLVPQWILASASHRAVLQCSNHFGFPVHHFMSLASPSIPKLMKKTSPLQISHPSYPLHLSLPTQALPASTSSPHSTSPTPPLPLACPLVQISLLNRIVPNPNQTAAPSSDHVRTDGLRCCLGWRSHFPSYGGRICNEQR
jgi:hypothetical protein